MLLEFVIAQREEIVRLTRGKVAARSAPQATADELQTGVPLFLTQFVELLKTTNDGDLGVPETPAINASAAEHGKDLLKRGFTIAQVVQDYGDICQAITELAGEEAQDVSPAEFHLLNLCLDNAVSKAVTEYSRQRDLTLASEEVERMGFLAHELRNLISTAIMAFQALESGTVAIKGSTGGVLRRSLQGLRDLVDRSLAAVRLDSGHSLQSRVMLAEFVEELEVAAALDAKAKGVSLTVAPVEYGVAVQVDRQLLSSGVANLLQNAFKFTPGGGHVALRTHLESGRVRIEVEDECGGLPPGKAEALFRPFDQRGPDKTGLGLGLAITRRIASASGGEVRVENKPGRGCVFVIELPAAPSLQ